MEYSYCIEKEISILHFLFEKKYSKSLIQAIMYQGGDIIVNSKSEKIHTVLYPGDVLKIILPAEKMSEEIISTNMKLDIVYEDEYILVINKLPFVPSIPSIRHPSHTVVNGVKHLCTVRGQNYGIHLINRLDKDTSGLLMVAKNRYIHHLFSEHVPIDKKYLAIVSGNITEDVVIEANILREHPLEVKRIVHQSGDYAKTLVKVIKNMKDECLVELTLFTGRTHQIRVHMNYISHPIIGDILYNESFNHESRLYLHCFYYRFIHPMTNRELIIKTEVPNDFIDRLE